MTLHTRCSMHVHYRHAIYIYLWTFGTNIDVDFFLEKTLAVFHKTATQAHKESGSVIADIFINVSY